jgi:hypothetical protein
MRRSSPFRLSTLQLSFAPAEPISSLNLEGDSPEAGQLTRFAWYSPAANLRVRGSRVPRSQERQDSMNRLTSTLLSTGLTLAILLTGCGDDDDASGTPGSGGSDANTGGKSTGGASLTGGSSNSGGQSTGGSSATAGSTATGGAADAGGAPGEGGAENGGSLGEGGASDSGGATAAGGAADSGGAPSDGGSSANGGAPSDGGAPDSGGVPGAGGDFAAAGAAGSASFDAAEFCVGLCDCVGDNGGNQPACEDSCPSQIAGGATREQCEAGLIDSEEGVDACIPVCAALP